MRDRAVSTTRPESPLTNLAALCTRLSTDRGLLVLLPEGRQPGFVQSYSDSSGSAVPTLTLAYYAYAPLMADGHARGYVYLGRGVTGQPFSLLEIDYLHLFAEVVARQAQSHDQQLQLADIMRKMAALEQAASQQALAETLLVVNAINAVNRATSLEEVLAQVLDTAINLAHGVGGAIMLLDEHREGLNVRVTRGDAIAGLQDTWIPLQGSLSGRVLLTGQPQSFDGTQTDQQLQSPIIDRLVTERGILVPLRVQERRVGVLNIYGINPVESPDLRITELVQALATEAALAIERVRLLEELSESETRYRTLAERLPLVLYRAAYDADLGHVYINHAVEPLLGYPQSQWFSQLDLWLRIVHPEDLATVRFYVRRALETHTSFTVEYRLRHADGHWVWVKDTGKVVRDEQGDPLWIEGVLEDVSDRHQVEEALRVANRDLKEALHAKEELIQNVSHELRTPLTHIRGYAEMLADGMLGDLTSAQKDAITAIYTKGLHLTSLIDDLLLLRSIGIERLDCQPMDLLKLTNEVISHMMKASAHTQIGLRLETDASSADVYADVHRLHQVLDNLVGNAFKFTPNGGWVVIRINERQDAIHLAVTDSGPGIPPEALKRIFERFYQVDSSRTRAHGGMGIGLAIARELIQAHRGRIWAENTPGAGATFHVLLSCKPPEGTTEDSRPRESRPGGHPGSRHPLQS